MTLFQTMVVIIIHYFKNKVSLKLYFLKKFPSEQIALLAKMIVRKVSYFFLKQIGTKLNKTI